MDNTISYTTPTEQLEKLKSQNLLIENETAAKELLEICGYSNLIKSYREPYVIMRGDKKYYRSGVSFNQLYSLYLLDKNLRNGVMASMQDLEEHIKEAAADVLARSFGIHQDNYLQFRNFRNKRKRKQRFSLTSILKTMRQTLDTDKNPIHHYKTEHGIVPPWILFKSVYFSTIVNFIDQFKSNEQINLIHRLYNIDSLKIDEKKARILMMDSLFISLEYRNAAAHGARIYNYNCQNQLRIDTICEESENHTFFGFSQLLFVLDCLNYRSPHDNLYKILNAEVSRHCNQYPQDVTYLGQILNMDIETPFCIIC